MTTYYSHLKMAYMEPSLSGDLVWLLPVCTCRGSDLLLVLLRCLPISSTPSDSSMCSSALAAPFRFSQLSLSSAPVRTTDWSTHKSKPKQTH